MIEIGVITELKNKGKQAKVEFERKTQCEKCGMCLANKKDMRVHVIVDNCLNARVGDRVEIQMQDGVVVLSAIIVYGIPTMAVVLAVVIGILAKLSELWCFGLAMITLVVCFVGIAFIDKYIKKKKRIVPVMVKIMEVL